MADAIASRVKLVQTNFSKIEAKIGVHEDAKGGSLSINLEMSLKDSTRDGQAIGKIAIDLFGLPKGVTDMRSFAFHVAIEVNGVFEWNVPEARNVEDETTAQSLLQNLYVVGVTEIRSLVQKLGFPTIDMPWDIKAVVEKSKPMAVPKAKKIAAAKPKVSKLKAVS